MVRIGQFIRTIVKMHTRVNLAQKGYQLNFTLFFFSGTNRQFPSYFATVGSVRGCSRSVFTYRARSASDSCDMEKPDVKFRPNVSTTSKNQSIRSDVFARPIMCRRAKRLRVVNTRARTAGLKFLSGPTQLKCSPVGSNERKIKSTRPVRIARGAEKTISAR